MKTFPQRIKEQLAAGAVMMPRVPKGTTYNGSFVTQVWAAAGIATPQVEYQFHDDRRWKFDFAWPNFNKTVKDSNGQDAVFITMTTATGGVALEVQGGIWTHGRHTRGAALKKEWEKLNAAAVAGWRILYCQPSEVTGTKMVNNIKKALGI